MLVFDAGSNFHIFIHFIVFDVLAHNISIGISFLELTAVAIYSVYCCVLEFPTRHAVIYSSPQHGIVYCLHFHRCNTVVINVHYNFVYEICNKTQQESNILFSYH